MRIKRNWPSNEADTRLRNPLTIRPFILRLGLALAIIFFFALLSRAGGPKYVAGSTYFESTVNGVALTWENGSITYYTDQGDLSPVLPNAAANTFVANAFALWTSIPTAAVTATRGGQLAENVSGANVYVNSSGTVIMPADIQPSATSTPVGVVYDYDGEVTNALLGEGAGDSSQCFFNAAYGGADNFAASATFLHALIVINGECALEPSQLVDVEYRLARVIGGVIGVGWSQLNLNAQTGDPTPTAADYAGFPVMHYTDPLTCVPITNCYPNPYQLAVDDMAGLSRLYPVTAQNQSNFPNSEIFSTVTARIHGSVLFADSSGTATQAMQGVNVVARWIDPSSGIPSGQYALSSVSGFRFTGNAGNPITGFYDALGNSLSKWGSNSQTLEGDFDLAGLPLPNGGSAQYQLTVESLDPTWSIGVGPYAPMQVSASGLPQPIIVTVSAGQDVEQNILMSGSAQPVPPFASSQTWTSPAAVPLSGDWMGSLSSYGDVSYLSLTAQANRTLSISVTALDESGNPSESKLQPVIGMWAASDPAGTAPPASTPTSFNSTLFGMSQLNAQIESPTNFMIGIADLRGDGRPDYRYEASVLYADSIAPQRLPVTGGAVTVSGTGFSTSLTGTVGSTSAPPLAVSSGQMIINAPPFPDGTQSVTITNPANGASSTMQNALTFGAAATDTILLLSGALNPPTPVGTQAVIPVQVQVVASDGVTPVAGATIGWNATNNLQLSACNSTSSCTVTSDQDGYASTWLTPATTGVSTITATLAPGVYSPSSSVQATLDATPSASNIGVTPAYLWVAQGSTVSVPITVLVFSDGSPKNNATVDFTVVSGSATLSASSAKTNSTGYATVNLQLSEFAAEVQVNACVAGTGGACQQIIANVVSLSQLNLLPVSGQGQTISGQNFQPVVVRVVDSASPPDDVLGATVTFLTTVLRPAGSSSTGGNGETNPINPNMPVILSVIQSSVTSDINGLASVTPSNGGFSAPLEVDVSISTGTSAFLNDPLELLPPVP
jgi:hypothetical protein